MSTVGEPSTSRRMTTRSAARASSEPAAAQPAVTPRRGPRRRAATPGVDAPVTGSRVTNTRSKAYGARGKLEPAQQMSAKQALDESTDPLASAVQASEGQQLSTASDSDQAPALQGQAGAGPSRPRAHHTDLPPLQPVPQGEPIFQSEAVPSPGVSRFGWLRSFFGNLSAWTPAIILCFWRPDRGHDREPPNSVQAYMERFRREREEAEERRRNAQAVYEFMWLLTILAFLFAMTDIYKGPVFGPKYDFVHHRLRFFRGPGDMETQRSTSVNGRLDKLERLFQSLTHKSRFPEASSHLQVNWFSASNGAVVDPYLSSPVDRNCKGVKEHTWYTRIFSINAKCEDASYPHGQALLPWSEPDERWCAPPSRGKLQLTVDIAHPIAPTELVLEHLPKDASLRIGDAPKELELWVDIPDADVYNTVNAAIAHIKPDLLVDSSPQKDRELDEKQALPFTFVPVGRWIYNIYEKDHIQTFEIPFPLQKLGVKATRFAVRVNSNWGDYGPTCIYRARLHGHDQTGQVEKLDDDPRKA